MASVIQLDLFGPQSQRIRYGLFSCTDTGTGPGDTGQSVSDADHLRLRNGLGDLLFALPNRRSLPRSEHVRHRILLEGAFAQDRPLSGLQLPGLKLQHVPLAGVKRMEMASANLSGTTFTGGRLWADLRESVLTDMVAISVDWHGSRLTDCHLVGSRVTGSNFQSVSFRRSNLTKDHFQDCQLRMCDFSFCQLRRASLKGSDLSGSDLRQADLTGCDIRGVFLRGASLPVTKLEKANIQPIRQRIQDLALTYPVLIPLWLTALEEGCWLAGSYSSLSEFISACLGRRVGAGWQNIYGSTEWIIWQFLRSIQVGERVTTHSLAHLLHRWLFIR